MEELDRIRGLLVLRVPPYILEKTDLSRLELRGTDLVDRDIGERRPDFIAWAPHSDNSEGVYFIGEIQSYLDSWIAVRFLRAIIIIMSQLMRRTPRPGVLPIFVTLILSYAKSECPETSALLDDVPGLENVPPEDAAKFIRLDSFVFDVRKQDRRGIPQLPVLASLRWSLLVWNVLWDDDPYGPLLEQRDLIREVQNESGGQHVLDALWEYLDEVKQMTPEIENQVENLGYYTYESPPKPGGLAWRRYQDGIDKGRSEEARRILSRLMMLRFGPTPEWALNKLNSATVEDIESWSDRLLSAHDVQGVFN